MNEHHFQIPLTLEATRAARPGDAVYLSGPLFTARPLWYCRILDEKLPLPVDLDALGANVLIHTAPLVRQTEDWWEMVAIVPMPDWLADAGKGNVARIIEHLGLRAVIGKGRLDGLAESCAKHQCLHLITLGTWNNFARQIERVIDVGWLDLGNPEAMWVFQARGIGTVHRGDRYHGAESLRGEPGRARGTGEGVARASRAGRLPLQLT